MTRPPQKVRRAMTQMTQEIKSPIEFVRLIANKEILTKLLSPAERHMFSKAVHDYYALLEQCERLAAALKSSNEWIKDLPSCDAAFVNNREALAAYQMWKHDNN